MAHESFPNDAHNARALTLSEHEQIAAPLGLSGLIGYSGTAPVHADSTGMQVKIRDGVSGMIQGTRYNNTSEATIPIAANSSGNTRIDLIVLRLRRTETSLGAGDQYTIVPHRIEGTPAGTPVPPSPVRDNTPGAGYWDIPLAEVTVINGASTITAAQCVSRAYYITGSGYTGRDDWGKPPVEPGVMFRAADSGTVYISSATEWVTLRRYTGWVPITIGQSKAGWDMRDVAVNRDGRTCVMTFYIVRTGAAVGASTHQYFGPVPAEFMPNKTVYGVYQCSSPDHTSHAIVRSDGVIQLAANGTHALNNGAQILCNMTWTTDAA
jgi:hypothetical protein